MADETFGPSVDVARETFAVLIGFALTEFVRKQFELAEAGTAADWFNSGALSLAFLWLLLRFFMGSANHLKATYVETDAAGIPAGVTDWKDFLFIVDAVFLVVFGVFAIYISRAEDFPHFTWRVAQFLIFAVIWTAFAPVAHRCVRGDWPDKTRLTWWLFLNPCQWLTTEFARARCRPLCGQPLEVGLAVLYLLFFVGDLLIVLRIRRAALYAAAPAAAKNHTKLLVLGIGFAAGALWLHCRYPLR